MKSLSSVEVLSEIRVRLRSVQVEDRARWGKMTAKRMMRHLACSYEVALGDRTVEPVTGLPPVLMKWLALRSGLALGEEYADDSGVEASDCGECGCGF